MLRDVADNGLTAVAHRHVLYGDGRLAMAAVAVERLDLGGKRAGEPAQCARGTVVLGEVVRIREVMGTSHRHHMNRNHLRDQHGFDGIPGLDALHLFSIFWEHASGRSPASPAIMPAKAQCDARAWE